MACPDTPEISIELQGPPGQLIHAYNVELPALDPLQASTIPRIYRDSMHIREQVFVRTLTAVPLKHHQDRDDARSCHWVLYTSTSPTQKTPIGTIRLVPYPTYPHPPPGASYTAPTDDVPGLDAETLFSAPLPKYEIDRSTSLHDGIEPYVKLGRMCVLEEYRGKRCANLLVQSALEWARTHPNFSVDGMEAGEREKIPKWKGLVCIHASVKAVGMWKRSGFVVDESMGRWFEGGMEHVGMFCRVKIE